MNKAANLRCIARERFSGSLFLASSRTLSPLPSEPGPSFVRRLPISSSFVIPIQRRTFSSTAPACHRTKGGRTKTHYEALNIPHNASRAEIKGAYFRLSKLYHPDLRRQRQGAEDASAAEDEKAATEMFHSASEAYKVLGDDRAR